MNLYAIKCSCGAITIMNIEGEENFSNSMRPVTFKKLLRNKGYRFSWLEKSYCCDHCINKWGIDLCGCGSGEKLGKCSNKYSQCKNKEAAQFLFVRSLNSVEAMFSRGSFA